MNQFPPEHGLECDCPHCMPTSTVTLFRTDTGELVQDWQWDGKEEVTLGVGDNLTIEFGRA